MRAQGQSGALWSRLWLDLEIFQIPPKSATAYRPPPFRHHLRMRNELSLVTPLLRQTVI